jgi:mycothiol synthase
MVTLSRTDLNTKRLIKRSYAGEKDLQAIANFLNLCETVDHFGQYYSESELRQDLSEPGFNPERDVRLWMNQSDHLIAYAQMWIPQASSDRAEADGYLWFRVHPLAREHGLEAEILNWGETRVQEVGQERGLPALLRSGCRDSQSDRILLFQNHGFTYERCFLRMERSLLEPIPVAQLPEGFTLAYAEGEQDIEARVDLHNQSFIDHWNHHPSTVEEWRHWDNDEQYQAELDLLSIASDGTYAAYCRCYVDRINNAHQELLEGWINLLGTRRGFRRLGLGRSMLLMGLEKLRSEGMEVAKLGVDMENPNQAMGLYESVGFRKVFANFAYVKRVGGVALEGQ